MAKQNVTFIERHLEKVVVGVCGAALLAVAWLYVINSPNVVLVAGEALGPKDYYARFDEAAARAANKAKSENPKTREKPKETLLTKNPRPYEVLGLPDRLVAFVPPSPKPPAGVGPGIIATGNIQLAEILPPLRPVLTTGHAQAILPEPHIEVVGDPSSERPAPSVAAPVSQDHTWVAVLSAVDRKGQRDRFQAAKYPVLRQSLMITEVQAERQELRADGQWGEPEAVTGFATLAVQGPNTLKRVMNEEAGYEEIPPDQIQLLEDFRKKFESYEKEQEILRPAIQKCLGDEWWQWTLPRTLPGYPDTDLTEEGVKYLEVSKKTKPTPKSTPKTAPLGPGTPGQGGPGAGAPGGRNRQPRGRAAAPATPPPSAAAPPPSEKTREADANKQAIEAYKQAEKAFKGGEFIKGAKLLEPVIENKLTPEAQLERAEKLLASYQDKIDQAQNLQQRRQEQRIVRATLNYGPDIDPLWVTDTSVTPGKVYRYRLRVVALNAFAGLERMVVDPKDATKVVLTSSWSEWSDPIAVRPDRHLFFRQAADRASAQFEIQQFTGGTWRSSGNAKVAVGQPLTTGSGKSKMAFGAVVVDVGLHVPFKERVIAGKAVDYRDVAQGTETLTLVNARGEVEERYAAADVLSAREFQNKKAEEQRVREDLASGSAGVVEAPAPGPAATGAPAPAPQPGNGPK